MHLNERVELRINDQMLSDIQTIAGDERGAQSAFIRAAIAEKLEREDINNLFREAPREWLVRSLNSRMHK